MGTTVYLRKFAEDDRIRVRIITEKGKVTNFIIQQEAYIDYK